MLILSRFKGESIQIADNITITIIGSKPSGIAIGVDAPREVSVLREEAKAKKPAGDRMPRKQQ